MPTQVPPDRHAAALISEIPGIPEIAGAPQFPGDHSTTLDQAEQNAGNPAVLRLRGNSYAQIAWQSRVCQLDRAGRAA